MSDVIVLIDEIATDPLGRNYATMTDKEVAVDMNAQYRQKDRVSMTASEVFQAIDLSELLSLSDANYRKVLDVLHMGVVNPFGKEADIFVSIFGGSSATITTLAVIRREGISRGVEIGWGLVKEGHIQMARGYTGG